MSMLPLVNHGSELAAAAPDTPVYAGIAFELRPTAKHDIFYFLTAKCTSLH